MWFSVYRTHRRRARSNGAGRRESQRRRGRVVHGPSELPAEEVRTAGVALARLLRGARTMRRSRSRASFSVASSVKLASFVCFASLASLAFVVGGCADAENPTRTPPLVVAPADPAPADPADPASPSPPPVDTTPAPACNADVYVADGSQWRPTGTNPKGYEMGGDATRSFCGKPGAHVRSLPGAPADKFGALIDAIPATPYRNKRIRMRGVVETANVDGSAGLWLRVDGADKSTLAFDNMGKRPLRGTLAPEPYAIVLDVPDEASSLVFGVRLGGAGEVWTQEVTIEVVGLEVPTTDS